MNNLKLAIMALLLGGASAPVWAGGILTNTNQNVIFLRNPSRDAAIGIDGVYSNPAGVAFMSEGWHLSLNWQAAFQTRSVTSTNPLFKTGVNNEGQDTKKFKGEARAPFIPSVQVARNKGKWSLQGSISLTGGGGKCIFDTGLGTFESAVGGIATQLGEVSKTLNASGIAVPQATGYGMNSYLRGEQYYFGIQAGAAYKVNDNLSVYGGLRVLYGYATYKVRIDNLQVNTNNGLMTLPGYFEALQNGITTTAAQIKGGIDQYVAGYMAAGMTQEQAMQTPAVQELVAKGQAVSGVGSQIQARGEMLAPYINGVNMQCDQQGWGIAPVIGVDYKVGDFNFAAKYEFKTRMRLKNESTVKDAGIIDAVNKFKDGEYVEDDSPALLTVGAQWSITPKVRVNAGYHMFFDKDAHWYQNVQKKLDGNTWEVTGGAEWDVTDKLQVSGGLQKTNYGLSDSYMNDMSFVVDSYSFGFGLGYKVTPKVKVNMAYFQTNYDTYDRVTQKEPKVADSFTRTNRVFGLGVDFEF